MKKSETQLSPIGYILWSLALAAVFGYIGYLIHLREQGKVVVYSVLALMNLSMLVSSLRKRN